MCGRTEVVCAGGLGVVAGTNLLRFRPRMVAKKRVCVCVKNLCA